MLIGLNWQRKGMNDRIEINFLNVTFRQCIKHHNLLSYPYWWPVRIIIEAHSEPFVSTDLIKKIKWNKISIEMVVKKWDYFRVSNRQSPQVECGQQTTFLEHAATW